MVYNPQAPLIAQGLKRCGSCKEVKALAEFRKTTRRAESGGVAHYCKPCAYTKVRESYYRRVYGITIEEYDAILKKQKGVCAICRKPPNTVSRDGKSPMPLHVDHDHETGAVRALLCHNCNVGIGNLKHDIDLLQAAIDYLRQPRLL